MKTPLKSSIRIHWVKVSVVTNLEKNHFKWRLEEANIQESNTKILNETLIPLTKLL